VDGADADWWDEALVVATGAADVRWVGGMEPAVAFFCVGDVTADEDAEGAAEGDAEGAVDDGDEPTPPRRRQAAQVQLFRQEGHRQLMRSSADMWLMT